MKYNFGPIFLSNIHSYLDCNFRVSLEPMNVLIFSLNVPLITANEHARYIHFEADIEIHNLRDFNKNRSYSFRVLRDLTIFTTKVCPSEAEF